MDSPCDLIKQIKDFSIIPIDIQGTSQNRKMVQEKHMMILKRLLMIPDQVTLSNDLWQISIHCSWENRGNMLLLIVNMNMNIIIHMVLMELPIQGKPRNRKIPLREYGIRFPGTRMIPVKESGN